MNVFSQNEHERSEHEKRPEGAERGDTQIADSHGDPLRS